MGPEGSGRASVATAAHQSPRWADPANPDDASRTTVLHYGGNDSKGAARTPSFATHRCLAFSSRAA